MSLYLVCQCGSRFTAEPHLAGKSVKCPKCGMKVKLPPPAPLPPTGERGAGVSPVAPASGALNGVGQGGVSRGNVDTNSTINVAVSAVSEPTFIVQDRRKLLALVGVLMMVYGALNVGVSLYATVQMSGSAELIPLPDELGGQYFRNAVRHSERAQYMGTILCVAFGSVQFAGGLGAMNLRFWGAGVAGSVLLMVPCLGSAFPCCVVVGFPLGLFSLFALVSERDSFI